MLKHTANLDNVGLCDRHKHKGLNKGGLMEACTRMTVLWVRHL